MKWFNMKWLIHGFEALAIYNTKANLRTVLRRTKKHVPLLKWENKPFWKAMGKNNLTWRWKKKRFLPMGKQPFWAMGKSGHCRIQAGWVNFMHSCHAECSASFLVESKDAAFLVHDVTFFVHGGKKPFYAIEPKTFLTAN